jgi:cardiolipin synthase
LNLPNYLTLLRIILVPVFFTLLVSYGQGEEHYRVWALLVFVIAALTDALDGLAARFMNQRTELGTFLDPLADKLLLLSGYLGILFVSSLPHHPPLWITVTIVFRDIVIVAGMLIIFLITKKVKPVNPHWLGKVTTFFQMAGLVAILLKHDAAVWLWNITALLTLLSGGIYVRRGIQALAKGSI